MPRLSFLRRVLPSWKLSRFPVLSRGRVKQRNNRIAIASSVVQSFQDQDHGGIARSLLPCRQDPGRRLVDRLTAQIHRSDHGCVKFAVAQQPGCHLQGPDAGQLFRGHGEARPTQVQLHIEAVGRDVGHGTDHHCRIQRPNQTRPG